MTLVSRRRMYAPQMPCEGVSVIHLILAISSSTCQTANPSRTLHSGPRESPFQGAKESLVTPQAKTFRTIPQEIPPPHQTKTRPLSVEIYIRVRQPSIPTLVPLDYSCITNRYNISFAKPGFTASVCLSFVCKQFSLFTTVHVSRRTCHGATDPLNISSIEATVL